MMNLAQAMLLLMTLFSILMMVAEAQTACGKGEPCPKRLKECPCDKKRKVAEVTVPGNEPEHTLLTLDEFKAIVVDQESYGVWEVRDPSSTFIRAHFGLTLEINSVENETFYRRRVRFDKNRFDSVAPSSPNCVDYSGSTMHPVNEYGFKDLAVFRLHFANNTRLLVLFSSCPTKYVLMLQCFDIQSDDTLATRTCPPENALVVVWVKGERTAMDELPLSQIEQDLYDNTGLNSCQLDNMKSFYILGENQCTASGEQFRKP